MVDVRKISCRQLITHELRSNSGRDRLSLVAVVIAIQPILSGHQLMIDPQGELVRVTFSWRQVAKRADIRNAVRRRTKYVDTGQGATETENTEQLDTFDRPVLSKHVRGDGIRTGSRNVIAELRRFHRGCRDIGAGTAQALVRRVEECPVLDNRSAKPIAELIPSRHRNDRIKETP